LLNLELDYLPKIELKTEYNIGVVGAGVIVDKCHLVAYKENNLNVVGICSKRGFRAYEVAKKHGIKKVYNSAEELCKDPNIDVVDIAIPPTDQLEVVKLAAKHNKHILCQKPLAYDFKESKKIVEIVKRAGVKLAVNQNCRWAPASRGVKILLEKGFIGKPIIATIELRVRLLPQIFTKSYDKLMILNMSVHHLDVFRYWFGEPKFITAVASKYPGQEYKGELIALYNLEYENGLLASAWDDGFTWSNNSDADITFRIEGIGGIVNGSWGWYHNRPDTIEFTTKKYLNYWFKPIIKEKWFPDAFAGTMGDLLMAIDQDREPEISGMDNLKTMRLVEAAYKSIKEKRAVALEEIALL